MNASRPAMLASRLVVAAAAGLLAAGMANAQAPNRPDASAPGAATSPTTVPWITETLNKAKAAFDRGDYLEAFGWYREILLRDDGNGPALLGLARTLAANGRFFQAERQYRRYVDGAGKNDPRGYLGLGLMQARLKTHNLAARSFRQALELDPGNTVAMTNLALTMRALHKDDEALEWVRKALAIRHDDHAALHALALIQRQRRQIPDAIVAIRQAIDIVSRMHLAEPGAVTHLLRLQEYHRVLFEALKTRVDSNPDDVQGWLELSVVRRQTADGDRLVRYFEALRDLTRAAALAPKDLSILEPLADLQIELRLNDVAAKTCRQIVEIDPDHAAATKWLERLESKPPSP